MNNKNTFLKAGVFCFLGLGTMSYAQTNEYDGRVGINTDAPSATLNVKSKTGTGATTKNFELENANSTKLVTVLDNGNVGVNNSNPVRKLDVVGGSRFAGENGGVSIWLEATSSTGNAIHRYRRNGSVRWDMGMNGVADTDTHGGADFYITSMQNDGNTGDRRFTIIRENGNVGIGAMLNPSEKLDVGGNVRVRNLPSNVGAAGDKVVVVDDTGVLKSVDRSTLGTAGAITTEVDGIIGNEVVNATTNGGLVRSGDGTDASPYTLGLPTTGAGLEVGSTMTWDGTKWVAQKPAAPAATTLGALTGKIHIAPSITAGQWKTDGIFAFVQTSTETIKLPSPADFENKIISVNNQAKTLLNYAAPAPLNNSTLQGGKGHLLMSDGTNWYVIGGSY